MMRQAGRYLPEYRQVREKLPFFDLCQNVDAAVEVSLHPFTRFHPDAVIVFSDILVPLQAMGVDVLMGGGGPRLADPVRTMPDVERLSLFDPLEKTRFVPDAIAALRKLVGDNAAVLGFAGAPWTLAAYLVEGKASRHFEKIKAMTSRNPEVLRELLSRLSKMTSDYLEAQVDAGADAIQIFDTWAGELTARDYRAWALPPAREVIAAVRKKGKPVIYFLTGTAPHLDAMAETGADILSIDWRMELLDVRRRFPEKVLQGNLDPAALLGTPEAVFAQTREMVSSMGGRGHILNLGHGILPSTPIECVEAFYEAARS